MKRFLAVAVVLVFALFPSGALGAGKVKTKVKSLDFEYFSAEETRVFTVKLKSDKDKCVENRKVFVQEETGELDDLAGSAKSDEDGVATIYDSPAPAFEDGEKFYVVVDSRRVGNTRCKAAVSRLYEPKTRRAAAKQGGAAVETKVKSLDASYYPMEKRREYRVVLKSDKDKCVDKRTVRLIQKYPGQDKIIGTEKSDDKGFAFIDDSPAPAFTGNEKFYVKVRARTAGNTLCKREESEVFRAGGR